MQVLLMALMCLVVLLLSLVVGLLGYAAYKLMEFEKRRIKSEHDARWEVFESTDRTDFEELYQTNRRS